MAIKKNKRFKKLTKKLVRLEGMVVRLQGKVRRSASTRVGARSGRSARTAKRRPTLRAKRTAGR